MRKRIGTVGAVVGREWNVETLDGILFEVIETQYVLTATLRTRKRKIGCGCFATYVAAQDYIRFTFQHDAIYGAAAN